MATEHDISGDCSDEVEEIDDKDEDVAKMINFPQLLKNMQNRSYEYLQSLPKSVKRRLRALKKLQLDSTNIEAKFFQEVHALECKYNKLYTPLYEKRLTIISGAYEPNEDECDFPSDEEEDGADVSKELKEKLTLEEAKREEEEEALVKGVPEFWLTIFKNVNLLAEMVQPHDEPILKHLSDIKVYFVEEPMGFKLDFHFTPNEYFTNTVLTKEYDMKCVPETDEPFSFEGPEIYKCRGCTINWNKGKNVTMKTLKKKQKHKSRGVIRTVTKTVQNDSFFNFFSPPSMPEDLNSEEVDDELRTLLTTDFEIGHYIRERIVPRAVLYFTGEGIDDEDEDYEEEEEEEEEDEDDDEINGGGKDSKYKKELQKENCKQQ